MLVAFTALWIAAWSVLIVQRNTLWLHPEKLWSAAVKDNPANARAWLNLAGVHMEKGEFDKAAKIYEMLMKYPQSRQTDMIYLNLGIISQQKGELDKALEYFTSAGKINPESFDAWANIGSISLIKGDNTAARKAYGKAISLKPGPGTAGVYTNLGIVELKEKHFQAAQEDFKKAIELNPDLLEARLNLANIYRSFGMDFEAGQQEREVKLRMKTGSNVRAYNAAVEIR
jgi:tetratricopeptide (TPR) repeat protein